VDFDRNSAYLVHQRTIPKSPATMTPDQQRVLDFDSHDPLRDYRSRFHIPPRKDGSPCIYLAGNSLGLQPKSVRSYIEQELKDWETFGVEGHFHAKSPWMPYHELLADQTARIVGALPSEVVVMNTLTVNLHLMMVSFYRPTALRHKIIVEGTLFPSDRYAIASQVSFHGFDPVLSIVELHPRDGETTLRTEDIEDLIESEGESIALILIGGVNYYTGQVFDMKRITDAGHRQGAVVGFDLAHAAGNIPLQLHAWDVDFAVWCSYKYLNSGPGSLAGCFVHERHGSNRSLPRFAGWWGQNKKTRFLMGREFDPIPGAEGWQVSNPPILSLAAIRASLEIFDEVGMTALRRKSELLTAYLEDRITERVGDRVSIITPKENAERGCQLSLVVHGKGKAAFEALTHSGIMCDWREPDAIRVAPAPLYNTFSDVFEFVEVLASVVKS
jgi:kynureninase